LSSNLFGVHKLLFRYKWYNMYYYYYYYYLTQNSPVVTRSAWLVPLAIYRLIKSTYLTHVLFVVINYTLFISNIFSSIIIYFGRKIAHSLSIHCVRIMRFITTTFYRYDNKASAASRRLYPAIIIILLLSELVPFYRAWAVEHCVRIACLKLYLSLLSE